MSTAREHADALAARSSAQTTEDASARSTSREVSKKQKKDSSASTDNDAARSDGGGTKAAKRSDSIAGALTRSFLGVVALFFRAPIRLYRPVKLSSWGILESLAKREGKSLNLRYLRSVLKREQASFLPHLLGPPLIINTLIGFTLFESYSLCERFLLRHFYPRRVAEQKRQRDENGTRIVAWSPLWIVGTSGFVAGAAQCIISAPLDNVRTILSARQRSASFSKVSSSAAAAKSPSSSKKQHHHQHRGHATTVAAGARARISWRAVLRAALLPFAPEQARTKLVRQVKQDAPRARWRDRLFGSLSRAAVWTDDVARRSWRSSSKKGDASVSGEGGAGASATPSEKAALEKARQLSAKQRRQQWEAQLKRWRGGVHGAGLVLSLVRDSVGFGAFFVIFEMSRRVAYTVSIGVDKVIAFSGVGPTLPPGGTLDNTGGSREHSGDDVAIEDVKTDYSYRAGRSLSGRLIAAFILVCGGAIGATCYELLGRPAELMRTVIWEGRKAWEKGQSNRSRTIHKMKAASPSKAATAAREKASERPKHAHARSSKRASLRGARVNRQSSPGSRGNTRKTTFIELRRGHTAGTLSTRIGSMRGLSGPPHPRHPATSRPKRQPSGLVPHVRRAERLRMKLYPDRFYVPPTLENRPSALSLLESHAERTSPLRWATSAAAKARIAPTPVPMPVLLLHTYFIAPFVPYRPQSYAEQEQAAAAARAGKRKRAIALPTPEELTRQRWTLNNPMKLSAAPGRDTWAIRSRGALKWLTTLPGSVRSIAEARQWGSGRMSWVLRRLATPYGIGFVAFAWLGGDLAA